MLVLMWCLMVNFKIYQYYVSIGGNEYCWLLLTRGGVGWQGRIPNAPDIKILLGGTLIETYESFTLLIVIAQSQSYLRIKLQSCVRSDTHTHSFFLILLFESIVHLYFIWPISFFLIYDNNKYFLIIHIFLRLDNYLIML